MNNTRRKEISKILTVLKTLQSDIENIKDDEEYSYDNLPEGFQDSDRGGRMQEAIENLDGALESIEESINYLEEASV